MICTNCGQQFADNAKFCPHCGTKACHVNFQNTPNTNNSIPSSSINGSDSNHFSFIKGKMIGNFTYKKIISEVDITNIQIKISQTQTAFLRKNKSSSKDVSFNQIRSIELKSVMDFWDTLYGTILLIIFTLALFSGAGFQWIFLLLSVLCFWSGHGKIISIETTLNERFQIPTDSTQVADQFIHTIQSALQNKL